MRPSSLGSLVPADIRPHSRLSSAVKSLSLLLGANAPVVAALAAPATGAPNINGFLKIFDDFMNIYVLDLKIAF